MLAKNICVFLVAFVVPGGRSWSFKTLIFEVSKTKQEKLLVYISTTLGTNIVVS